MQTTIQKKKELWLEIGFYMLSLGLWMLWAYILPFNEGPDEYMRSRIISYIVEYGGLPTGYQQEIMDYSWGFTYAFRPILPQMVEAWFIKAAMLFTEDDFLLLYAGRMVSVLCGACFAFYVRKIARLVFNDGWMQWMLTAFVIFLPQCNFMFTYLNCDSMALLSTAMIVYCWLKGHEDGWSYGTCFHLAIGISICTLSYYNAYGFILSSIILFIGSFLWREKGEIHWKEFWKKGLFIAAIVLLLAGWWFVRNYILYDGDFLGLKTQDMYAEHYAMEELKPSNRNTYKNQGRSMLDMLLHSDWAYMTIKSFIGMLGPFWYGLYGWMYKGYGLIFLLGLLGAGIYLWRQLREPCEKGEKRWRILFHISMILSIVLPNALNFWYSYSSDYQPQGRYSMPMIVPLMYYAAFGIWTLCGYLKKKKLVQAVKGAVIAWMLVILLVVFAKIMWPAYAGIEDKLEMKTYTFEEFYGEE